MHVDLTTLMIAGAFVALMSGALLVFARFQYRDTGPIMWWAASHFVTALGVIALAVAGTPPTGLLGVAAFALFSQAIALVWSAARRLTGRPAPNGLVFCVPFVVAGAAFATPLPTYAVAGTLTAVLSFGFLMAAAWTLAFQAREPLLSRWPLAFLCALHAVAIALTGPLQIPPEMIPAWLEIIFESIHFEALIYFLGTAIFVVAWARESNELRHKRAADTDVLTGLPNRRAFFEIADRTVERAQFTDASCAVAVFDIDHFKMINDTFGHETGDSVLKLFADVVRRTMRPGDVIGRIGGEEFAAIAGGAGIEAGVALAERVRKAFLEAAQVVDGRPINGTLSAGVSTYERGDDLGMILRRADTALYTAKLRGRNRVEAANAGDPAPRTNVVRVA